MKNVNERVDSGQLNAGNPKAYTFVYVHVWSKGVGNVEEVVRQLKQNPNVKIVTPEIFVELIRRNVKH